MVFPSNCTIPYSEPQSNYAMTHGDRRYISNSEIGILKPIIIESGVQS